MVHSEKLIADCSTNCLLPTEPQNAPTITVVQPQFKTVLVAWKPPSNVEGGIAEFVIQYRPMRGEWVALKEPGYSYTKTFYDVFEHSRRYEIRVAIINDGGSGPYSQSVQFTANTPGGCEWVCTPVLV